MSDPFTAERQRHRDAVREGQTRLLADLFNVPAARRTDPETSHEAAESMTEAAGHQRAAILRLLAEHPEGLTNDAIDQCLDLRVGTASRRTTELVRMGHLTRTDDTRLTRTGRRANVLRVA